MKVIVFEINKNYKRSYLEWECKAPLGTYPFSFRTRLLTEPLPPNSGLVLDSKTVLHMVLLKHSDVNVVMEANPFRLL